MQVGDFLLGLGTGIFRSLSLLHQYLYLIARTLDNSVVIPDSVCSGFKFYLVLPDLVYYFLGIPTQDALQLSTESDEFLVEFVEGHAGLGHLAGELLHLGNIVGSLLR